MGLVLHGQFTSSAKYMIKAIRDQMNMTEDEECFLLVDELLDMLDKGLIQNFTHIPNETFTKSWATKNKLKKMGVRKGTPDYLIVGHKKILFLEMKRRKKSTVSPEQWEWNLGLMDAGIPSYIAYGYDDAIDIIKDILL